MKLRNAKVYRKLTKKVTPRFSKIMDNVANTIARSAERGYTKATISVSDILYDVGIDIDESRFTSIVNLVTKELALKNFNYRVLEDKTISVYW